MVLKAQSGDTTFSYLCDWQYSNMENSSTQLNDSAEYFAVFFMTLDKWVFGNTCFAITDSSLFKSGNRKAVYVSIENNYNKSGKSNLLVPVERCQEILIYHEDCQYVGYPDCTPTCDHCPLCMTISSFNYCWEDYIDDGTGNAGNTGNNGGGGGGSGGGSGSGGGGTPPNCGGLNASKTLTQEGCSAGWIPDPSNFSIINYLTNTLTLNQSQINFLTQHQLLQSQIFNYLVQSPTEMRKEISLSHINKMMTDASYLLFVENHLNTGSSATVWWEDLNWLGNNGNFSLNTEDYGNQLDELNVQEKILVAMYPIQAYTIYKNKDVALTMTSTRMGSSGGLNDKKDAFRHAFFQAINTRDVTGTGFPVPNTGAQIVLLFANAHESEVPTLRNKEKDMDIYNNIVGISYCWNCWSTTNESIANAIMTKLNAGELVYLKPLLTPSQDLNFFGFGGVPDLQTATHGITANTLVIPTNQ